MTSHMTSFEPDCTCKDLISKGAGSQDVNMPSSGKTVTYNVPPGPLPSTTAPHLNTIAPMGFEDIKHAVPHHQPPGPQWCVTNESLVGHVCGASCWYRAQADETTGSRGKGETSLLGSE